MTINEQLKQKGYRLTKPRQELLKILSAYPYTVKELYEVLIHKDIQIDLASVYRSLELFVEMGVVHAIELGQDKKRYELVDEKNHHHHLVCNNCGTIQDIVINEDNFIEIAEIVPFKVDHHHLEFFGLCQKCQ